MRDQIIARPRASFVVVACVIGLTAVLLNPAFGGYDEGDHFARAWQISGGTLISPSGTGSNGVSTHGGLLPIWLYTDIAVLKFTSERTHDSAKALLHLGDATPSGREEFIPFAATASYSPIAYVGASAGIRIGRSLASQPSPCSGSREPLGSVSTSRS